MKILVQDTNGVRELEEGYASELELQVFLREHADLTPLEDIDLAAPPLLCIGWEVGVASGSEDILFVDPAGLITLVETKLRKNPESRREVVGQVLEYASYMAAWTASDVEGIAEKFLAGPYAPAPYRKFSLRSALESFGETHEFPLSYDAFLQQLQTNIERGHFRLLIAIDEPPEALIRTVEFVNRFSQRFEMYLIQLKRFHDALTKQNIFVPALFGKVATPRPSRLPPISDWQDYQQRGWPPDAIEKAKSLQERLMKVCNEWQPESRLYSWYTVIQCLGQGPIGTQYSDRHGVETWFTVEGNPEPTLPRGVLSRHTKKTLYLRGELNDLDDAQLRRLSLAALRQAGADIS